MAKKNINKKYKLIYIITFQIVLDAIKHTETCRCFVRVILYEEIDGHMNHLEYQEENRFTVYAF